MNNSMLGTSPILDDLCTCKLSKKCISHSNIDLLPVEGYLFLSSIARCRLKFLIRNYVRFLHFTKFVGLCTCKNNGDILLSPVSHYHDIRLNYIPLSVKENPECKLHNKWLFYIGRSMVYENYRQIYSDFKYQFTINVSILALIQGFKYRHVMKGTS